MYMKIRHRQANLENRVQVFMSPPPSLIHETNMNLTECNQFRICTAYSSMQPLQLYLL